jgi:hypothetical protein
MNYDAKQHKSFGEISGLTTEQIKQKQKNGLTNEIYR